MIQTLANPIQFAVVREDPITDIEVIEKFDLKNILLVASGGCTALAIAKKWPQKNITLFDPNPHQIALVKQKHSCLMGSSDVAKSKTMFNVNNDQKQGFNACGNFESLFRQFREFIWEFIATQEQWLEYFKHPSQEFLTKIIANKYWQVSFELFFHDSLLVAMFGPDAVQHAPKGSYPSYFRKQLENGLNRNDLAKNYFLHHIFLGYYLDDFESLPPYLQGKIETSTFNYILGYLADVKNLEQFDYIMLSNIFDWMNAESIATHITLLKSSCKKNSIICFRQLNNTQKIFELFQPEFKPEHDFSQQLLKKDRSLFYNQLNILKRV